MINKENFFLGSYVTFRKPNYLLDAVKQTIEFGGKSMMFFVGSPQSHQIFPKNVLKREAFHQALKKNNLDLANVVIHSSYLINLANISSSRVRENSLKLLTNVVDIADYLGVKNVILHPGSSLLNNRQQAMISIAHGLDSVLAQFPNVNICLETMSGKGSEVGKTFEELQYIISHSKHQTQITICFDLCHLFATGYDVVNNFSQVIEKFDQIIGLSKLVVVHVNDSLKPFGSHKDRHANIGQGLIGLRPMVNILKHSALNKLPLILETPYIDKQPPYQKEIRLLTEHCWK